MPASARRKAQQAWWAVQSDRGVLHVAEWMTGLAAAILVGALMFWPGQHRNQSAGAPVQMADVELSRAVMPPGSVADEPAPDEVELAQWMASDFSDAGTR